MRNNIIVVIIVLFCICVIGGVIFLLNKYNNEEQRNDSHNYVNTVDIESDNKLISYIKVIINEKIYNLKVEENETAQSFIKMLPQEYNMNELNGNEKYVYLDNILPTNPYNPEYIEAGDIMLYGNNCLVVFYKSFNTSYSYTKIGHIENIDELGDKNVLIKFEKLE